MDELNSESICLPTRQGYDLWADVYDKDQNPLILLETEHFEQAMGNVDRLRILDCGCGTGRHSQWLANAGAEVTALDFSRGMLAQARAKPGTAGVRFVEYDLQQPLPFLDEEFDRVVSALVVDHIPDLKSHFAELGRVCKPTGFVFISVMHPALMLRGVQARFTDPSSGMVTMPDSHPHQVSDYAMAILEAGLTITRMSEHFVDEALAKRAERARRYMGWPMMLLFLLQPALERR